MSFVYILKSSKNGRYYIGFTENVEKRLIYHNTRQVLSTRSYAPYELAFKKKFNSTYAAREAEQKLKKLKRKDYLDKIVKNQKLSFK